MAIIDMSLISVKNGGTFAMSWVAGTNPKALHSNFQRAHIYAVDIPEKCEEIMAIIRSKKNNLSFRVLFKLFFGTIHIYAEQVQHLYCITQNVVCFNKFVMKQYSGKRTSSVVACNTIKKRRLESYDGLDITSLLNESEIFNDYSEEKFNFPTEMSESSEKKIKTSTCIEIQQIQKITIRQFSWDSPQPEEEEAFGEATQDERTMLLSQFSADEVITEPTPTRKRKSSNEETDCSPFKKPNSLSNEYSDNIRCSPSFCNGSMSEFSIDVRSQQSTEAEKNISNSSQNGLTHQNVMSPSFQSTKNKLPMNLISLDDLNEISTSERLTNDILTTESVHPKPVPKIKHPLIVDWVTKIPKNDMEALLKNVCLNCHDRNNKEHIAGIEKYRQPADVFERGPHRRFQSGKLLFSFKSCLKSKLRQNNNVNLNRQLIIEEILGRKCENSEPVVKLKDKIKAKCKKSLEPLREETIKEFQTLFEINNNIPNETDQNNNSFLQPYGTCQSGELHEDVPFLQCSLDKIDIKAISFNFAVEAETQRSEWGKEGILLKLLVAWKTQNPIINMNTIIVGANRINAALAFRTLLDLAGQQYIEIMKDNNQSIESIKMGPRTVRQLNITYGHVN